GARHQGVGRTMTQRMSGAPEPCDSYWRLVEPIWRSVSIYDGPETFLRQFGQLRPEGGHLFASHWCVSEVCNGGLHQFFGNSTGVLAPEALEAFRALGLTEIANILAEAMRFFGTPYPRERDKRWEMLRPKDRGKDSREWDPFDDLDKRFFNSLRDEPDGWS